MLITPQEVKQRLWLMRNGIVADAVRPALRVAYRTVYGLTLPQIKEIAADCAADASLARELLADRGVREAPLVGAYVMPVDALDADEGVALLAGAPTREYADVLCHALLRRHPEAAAIAAAVEDRGDAYGALRLMLNILRAHPDEARAMAARHAGHPLAAAIADELEFIGS